MQPSPAPRSRARRAVSLLLAPLVLQAACATNPVTGRPEMVLMSESQEIAMGKQAAPEIAASMGIYQDDELQRYVEGIGLRMAALSERPHLPWQFRVIDDSAVNAFAVPGGFIYVTRGILAHMGSEAELASVLGHEIGHVTARHSVQQMTRQQLAQAGLAVGMIGLAVVGAGELGQMLGQAAGAGAQLLFLKYGRDDETQSDDLGFKYMIASGYAPTEMPHLFHTLARQTEASGGARAPEWASTHPAPENREGRIKEKIEKLPPAQREGRVDREVFLAKVDGIVFGADPRAGYFDQANVFHHPDLAFRLKFPKGWKTANQPTAVVGVSPDQDAMLRLTLAKEATAAEAADVFFSQQGIQAGRQSTVAVNGMNAVSAGFGASTQQGGVQGRVAFVELGEHVFQIVGFAPQQSFQANSKLLAESVASFARETDRKFLDVKAWRVQVVKPERSLTIEEFAKAYPGPVSAEELAIMNQIDPGQSYQAGVPVKRVIGTKLP
jgi:predicted Zn-dependent protease